MSASPIRFGAVDLIAPEGRGAMGEVWRGVVRERDLPVAVKFLLSAREAPREDVTPGDIHESATGNDPWLGLEREVRAIAQLDHPGIVRVYEYGRVPPEVALETAGRIPALTPYIVMERLGGGSLEQRPPQEHWADTRRVLAGLLDALAYAHARGVLHRDIKPRNIMWPGRDAAFRRPKLIDFGLSAWLHSDTESFGHEAVGTPAFMAPEQIDPALRRDQGPWTDLYAVGCLAYLLMAGRLPFRGMDAQATARAHLVNPPPPLIPRFSVPDEVGIWLDRMLAKDPDRRFQRAADALWALENLAAPRDPESQTWIPTLPTVADTDAELAPEARTTLDEGSSSRPSQRSSGSTPPEVGGLSTLRGLWSLATGTPLDRAILAAPGRRSPPPPPMPTHWRAEGEGGTDAVSGATDAGVSLFGLKALPVVGRDTERDQLWTALRRVREEGRTRLVLIRGPAGVGKSRLAQWIAERGHETGAASWVAVGHDPQPRPGDGPDGLVIQLVGAAGLSLDAAAQRIRRFFARRGLNDDGDAERLAQMLAEGLRVPSHAGGSPAPSSPPHPTAQVLSGSPTDGVLPSPLAAVRRVLAAAARDRPLIVWIDDVQWGPASVDLMAESLADPVFAPLLFVATARDESLAEQPGMDARVETLARHPQALTLRLGALDRESMQRLVRRLLGLAPDLAATVEARVRGNPAFAVDLVSDWIDRAALVVGAEGLVLAPDEPAGLPDDVYLFWREKVDTLVSFIAERSPPPGREEASGATDDTKATDLRRRSEAALEIAAALGLEVDLREWRAACARANVEVPSTLVGALLRSKLMTATSTHLRFAHGMFHESVLRRSLEADRLPEHHAACARALQLLHPRGSAGLAERVGRHWLAAGAFEEALSPLLSGARERVSRQDSAEARFNLDLWDLAAHRAGVPANDPRRHAADLLRLRALVQTGPSAAVEVPEVAARVAAATPKEVWPIRAEALLAWGRALVAQGLLDAGSEHLRAAFEVYAANNDAAGMALVLEERGGLLAQLGRRREALADMERAAALHGARQRTRRAARILAEAVPWAVEEHDRALAERLFTQAHALAGDGADLATRLAVDWAEVRMAMRYADDPGLTQRILKRAADRLQGLHGRRARDWLARILGARLAVGDTEGARTDLVKLESDPASVDLACFLACARALLAALRQDIDRWDRTFSRLEEMMDTPTGLSSDAIELMEQSVAVLRASGHPHRAAHALRLTLRMRRIVGPPERAAQLDTDLRALVQELESLSGSSLPSVPLARERDTDAVTSPHEAMELTLDKSDKL